MSNKKRKKPDKAIQARLTQQLETDNEAEKELPPEKPPETAADLKDEKEIGAEELIQTLQSIDSALSEDYEEVAEAEEEEQPEETVEVVQTAARPNKFYLVFALFIIIMSIIGIISTVGFVVDKVEEIADQTALKNEIALFIYPVVTVDPPEFSNATEIPRNIIVESAIWKIILTGDTSNYEKLYSTYMYVPAVDVEFAARSLFGSEAEVVHQTVGNAGSAFAYDALSNSYLVPISPRYTYYSPSVKTIANVGELYTVRVEYMPPSALAVEGVKLQNSANKIMEYTLSKSKNSMTIHSVRSTAAIGDAHAY